MHTSTSTGPHVSVEEPLDPDLVLTKKSRKFTIKDRSWSEEGKQHKWKKWQKMNNFYTDKISSRTTLTKICVYWLRRNYLKKKRRKKSVRENDFYRRNVLNNLNKHAFCIFSLLLFYVFENAVWVGVLLLSDLTRLTRCNFFMQQSINRR